MPKRGSLVGVLLSAAIACANPQNSDGSVLDPEVIIAPLETACVEGRGQWMHPSVPGVQACCQYETNITDNVFDFYWEFIPDAHFKLPNGLPQVPNLAHPNNVFFQNGSVWRVDPTYWMDVVNIPAECMSRSHMTQQLNLYGHIPPQLSYGEENFVGAFNPHIYFTDYWEQKAKTPVAASYEEACIALPSGVRTEVNCETLERMVQPLPPRMKPKGYTGSNLFYVANMGNHLSYPQHVAAPWVGVNEGRITFFSGLFLVSEAMSFIDRAAETFGCVSRIPLKGEKDVCYEECFDIPWNSDQVMPKAGFWPTRLCNKYTFAYTVRKSFDRFKRFRGLRESEAQAEPTTVSSLVAGLRRVALPAIAIFLIPSVWALYAQMAGCQKGKKGLPTTRSTLDYGAISA